MRTRSPESSGINRPIADAGGVRVMLVFLAHEIIVPTNEMLIENVTSPPGCLEEWKNRKVAS
jgi:hypothetical protein